MAASTKTPVMVLNELMIKRKGQSPNFTLINAICNTHDNEFTYQVEVEDVIAFGTGKSKKEAKHLTAYRALELLKEKGIVHPDFKSTGNNNKNNSSEVPSPRKPPVNCIGPLADMCCEWKLPEVYYTEISDVGPPHCKDFTYDCHLGSITTRATAGTKKQARQIASKEMLEKVMEMITDMEEENPYSVVKFSPPDNEESELSCKFMQVSNFGVKPNLKVKIDDYFNTIFDIIQEKNIPIENIYKCFDEPLDDEKLLTQVLEILELKYAVEVIQTEPYIVCLNVNIDTPFTAVGIGETAGEAINMALKEARQLLEIYLKIHKRIRKDKENDKTTNNNNSEL